MKNRLNYYLSEELNTKYNDWIIEFVANSIGLVTVKQSSLTPETHLCYLNDDKVESVGVKVSFNSKSILSDHILKGSFSEEELVSFDIINAIGMFLSDKVNKDKSKECYDEHDRLNSLNSFQKEAGYQDTPIVNVYVNYLKKILSDKFEFEFVELFPKGIKSVFILSHDVDDPVKYALLNSYQVIPKNLSLKNKVLYQLEAVKKSVERFKNKDESIYWVFDEVMNAEAKHGFKSTFFFATRNKYDKGAHPKRDVPYDVTTEEFAGVFKEMNSRGFEVGLHASYFAKNDVKLLLEEKDKLEKLSNKKLVGNRHHFWQIGREAEKTLQKHADIGLKYDSSLAYNDAPGYRRGVALPYLLFDTQTNKTVKNVQVPTFMMDSNFMKNPEFDQTESLVQAKHYIDKLCEVGGVGAIDWHVRTSYPSSARFKNWGDTYLGILDYLSEKEYVWVTSFEDYYTWIKKREILLK